MAITCVKWQLPNKEIRYVYSKEILQKLENMILPATVISVQEAMYIGDSEMLQQRIQTLLTQTVSALIRQVRIFTTALCWGCAR